MTWACRPREARRERTRTDEPVLIATEGAHDAHLYWAPRAIGHTDEWERWHRRLRTTGLEVRSRLACALSSGLSLSRAMKRLAPCTPRKWDVDKGVEPGREHLAFSARELVVEPRVRLLPRHRRSLLRRVEPPHRPALDHHVHRPPGLGQCMMISAGWYYSGRRVLRNRCNVRRVDGRCLRIAPGLNA